MHIVHSIAACPKVYDGCTSASSVLPVTWRRRGGYFSLLVHSHVLYTRIVWLKKKVYFTGCFLFEIGTCSKHAESDSPTKIVSGSLKSADSTVSCRGSGHHPPRFKASC